MGLFFGFRFIANKNKVFYERIQEDLYLSNQIHKTAKRDFILLRLKWMVIDKAKNVLSLQSILATLFQ